MSAEGIYAQAIRLLSECIDHLDDPNLSVAEENARELLRSYCELYRRRFDNKYGRRQTRRRKGK